MKSRSLKRHRMRTDRIRTLRESRGWTQTDLADHTGLSKGQIYRIEKGKSETSAETITKIAEALEVRPDYLLGLIDDPQGRITEKDLTEAEARLLNAYRAGKDNYEKLRNVIIAIASNEELMGDP